MIHLTLNAEYLIFHHSRPEYLCLNCHVTVYSCKVIRNLTPVKKRIININRNVILFLVSKVKHRIRYIIPGMS